VLVCEQHRGELRTGRIQENIRCVAYKKFVLYVLREYQAKKVSNSSPSNVQEI
jgi:hypothetical protein